MPGGPEYFSGPHLINRSGSATIQGRVLSNTPAFIEKILFTYLAILLVKFFYPLLYSQAAEADAKDAEVGTVIINLFSLIFTSIMIILLLMLVPSVQNPLHGPDLNVVDLSILSTGLCKRSLCRPPYGSITGENL